MHPNHQEKLVPYHPKLHVLEKYSIERFPFRFLAPKVCSVPVCSTPSIVSSFDFSGGREMTSMPSSSQCKKQEFYF